MCIYITYPTMNIKIKAMNLKCKIIKLFIKIIGNYTIWYNK